MEGDIGNEPFLAPISSPLHLDHLNPAVETLGRTVADLQDNRIDDPPQMFLDHPGGVLHGLKTTTQGPTQPARPPLQGPSTVDIAPQGQCHLLEGPGTGCLH